VRIDCLWLLKEKSRLGNWCNSVIYAVRGLTCCESQSRWGTAWGPETHQSGKCLAAGALEIGGYTRELN